VYESLARILSLISLHKALLWIHEQEEGEGRRAIGLNTEPLWMGLQRFTQIMNMKKESERKCKNGRKW
jgi:hypothetical protein